jgi:YtoQ family protein
MTSGPGSFVSGESGRIPRGVAGFQVWFHFDLKRGAEMDLMVYLAGEVHTDWRNVIVEGSEAAGLPVEFTWPVTDHPASDEVGVRILGEEEKGFWKDHKGAKVNAIRTRNALERADVVVVRFGEKYRQWNAAFDAGYAAALGKAIIVLHPPDFTHALKEIDAAALAVAERPEQVVEILEYVTTQA